MKIFLREQKKKERKKRTLKKQTKRKPKHEGIIVR